MGFLCGVFNLGGSEVMLILVVTLFLFGGKKLPELARGLGQGIREFKSAQDGVKEEIKKQMSPEEKED
ncbi:Sec-independent protein translocase subunit TatA/TatB [Sphingobacterium paucimobilis]|uniref:Sec-independent protein translocase protein TatA n=1 Tax=Sphingobacterium paucimobilis HER1398 TaxID=1346330 RepID=U2IZP3_9SPHI|nr:twin-arginine translocase TatA/TatE family subunit [Sphingobacterium paucimobilis]ERJ58149.1 hypothetical protein M472_05165 [Sphingobacterium paucimobilis HER1398]